MLKYSRNYNWDKMYTHETQKMQYFFLNNHFITRDKGSFMLSESNDVHVHVVENHACFETYAPYRVLYITFYTQGLYTA